MRVVGLVLAIAACGSPSAMSDDATAMPDATPCEQSAIVTGMYSIAPGMLGAVTQVKTWQRRDPEYTVQYLMLSDGAQQLDINTGFLGSRVARLTAGGAMLNGTGWFTRTGDPCAEGTFEADFSASGMLTGSYRGPYLGENPPNP